MRAEGIETGQRTGGIVVDVAAEAHADAEECDQKAHQRHKALGKSGLGACFRSWRGQPQGKVHDEEAKVLEAHHRRMEDDLGLVGSQRLDGHGGD